MDHTSHKRFVEDVVAMVKLLEAHVSPAQVKGPNLTKLENR